jgi:hypothetical protein
MNKIEKFIVGHRDDFNRDEPAEGHYKRFAGRLQARKKGSGAWSVKQLLQAAAIVILIVASTFWLFERHSGGESEHPSRRFITLADIDPEYRDAEIYYTALINRKYNEIRSFDFHNPEEQKILLRELSEMDTIYRSLEMELNSERGNQMIIDAMIMHYQIKLNIMSLIMYQLHQAGSAVHQRSFEDEIHKSIHLTGQQSFET